MQSLIVIESENNNKSLNKKMSIVKIIVFLTVIMTITQEAATFCTKYDEHGSQVRYCCTGSKGDGWNCEFICDNDCENGVCIGPQVCVCNKGFAQKDGPRSPCVPIEPRVCSEQCRNGTCIEDLCTCATGWTLQEAESGDVCLPQCVNTVGNMSHGCINGYCAAPGVCMCYESYELLPNNKFECQPVADDYLNRKLKEIWEQYFGFVIGAGALLIILLLVCYCRLCRNFNQKIATSKNNKHLKNNCIKENCEPLV